jgi:hypothetical protein
MKMSPRAYVTALVVLAGIAAVAFVSLSAGDRLAPTTSLTDQPGATFAEPRESRNVHQPIILRADSVASPEHSDQGPIRIPIRLSVQPPRADDEPPRTQAPADLTPAEFLTIPALDPPQLR